MTNVEIYLEGIKLDTFEDETISIVRKAADFADIDKIYNDYTKTFSLPATPNNNQAFNYYFDTNNNNTFDAYANNYAELRINGVLAWVGTIKLESVNLSENGAESYSITFYSDSIALQGALGDATIKDIDWSDYNHANTTATVRNALNGSAVINTDMWYAPISTERYWVFGGGGANDISSLLGTGAINVNEIRPFLPVSKVMTRIFDLAGYDLLVDMVGDAAYDDLCLWFDNGRGKGETLQDFRASTAIAQTVPSDATAHAIRFNNVIEDTGGSYDKANYTFNVQVTGSYQFSVNVSSDFIGRGAIQLRVNGSLTGSIINVTPSATSGSISIALTSGDVVEFTMLSSALTTIIPVGAFVRTVLSGTVALPTATVFVNSIAPEIKCVDFISGILKLFNAIIYFDKDNERFVIQRRGDWYANGNEVEVSEYIDVSKTTLYPSVYYKSISFKFQEAQDFLNKEFSKRNNRNYGNSSYDIGSKYGSEYNIELPFTNTIMTDINPSNGLYASFVVDIDENKANAPEAVDGGTRLFYHNGVSTSVGIYYVNDGSTTSGQANVNWVSSVLQGSPDRVLSFTQEIAEDGNRVLSSLFTEEYNEYIQEIYNPRVRAWAMEGYLPHPLLETVKMNDTLSINGKLFLIDTISANMTTGKAKLRLINKEREGR